MSYEIITDRLEVRSALDKNNPRYVVNGYALVPNKYDSYGYQSDSKGNINKVLKSMFTPHCIENIKKQAQFKKLFVDTKHELFNNQNIKSLVKGKISPEEEKYLDSFLDAKKLPIAKLNDIRIDEKGLFIETELNPMFREVDIDHKNYFDAIWYSLQNKFLNGISINFIPTDVTKDEDGNDVINELDISGFSYVDRPSLPEHNIIEVAIRSARDFLEVRSAGDKMEDEKAKLDAERQKLDNDRKAIEAERTLLEKAKEDAKQAEIARQAAEHKRTQEELALKAEALKQAEADKAKLQDELNRAKGVIGQQPPPSQRKGESTYDEKFYEENIKKITAKHDATMEVIKKGQQPLVDNRMSGFGELVSLQAQISPVAGLPIEDADYIQKYRLLERGNADIVIKR